MHADLKLHPLLFAILLSALSACSDKPEHLKRESVFTDSTLVNIYQTAYRRDTSALLAFTEHETPAYRMAAAKLMGSMPSEHCPERLVERLTDPIPYVRLYAAFSVGQFRDQATLPALEKAFKKATIPEIKAELLEAIGKCANQDAMDFLVLHNPNTEIEEYGKLKGIFQGTLGGLLKPDHLRTIVAHLKANHEDTRRMAGQILAVSPPSDAAPFHAELIRAFETEANPEVRSILLKALIRAKIESDFIHRLILEEKEPTLRAIAIQSLDDPSPLSETLMKIAMEGDPWPAQAASLKLAESDTLPSDELELSPNLISEIPEFAALVYRDLLRKDRRAGADYYSLLTRHWDNPVKTAVLMKAYTYHKWGIDSLSIHFRKRGPIGTAAWAAYLSGLDRFPSWRESFIPFSRAILEAGPGSQRILLARFLRNPTYRSDVDPETLIAALKDSQRPDEIEVRLELARTLEEFYGEKTEPGRSVYADVDWQLVRSLGKKVFMDIFTKTATIRVELLPEDAPASVAQLVTLADSGYYDGRHFHRVVPGFVTQGGGPIGDGYGSYENLLRSEFSPLTFGPGVVGLASAGPDTESCQFFITHVSVPRLDGRYTIVGATRDPVERLETGAKIDSIRIRR